MHRRTHRTRIALLATATAALVAAPTALAAPVDGGERNPSNNASEGYTRETQIIGEIAQNQGGHAANTGGYVTRQSNKTDSGGGAIYGCRAKAGTESCVAANNLNNGDAFRFQASTAAATIGQLRFGLDVNKAVDKPPFVTNGTGLVKNLNADRIDGKSAEDFVEKGSMLFASVGVDGAIAANRGVSANARATSADESGNRVFTVPFASDVSKCVATATATSVPQQPQTDPDDVRPFLVATPNGTSVTVTELGAAANPYGFGLQITC
jgi:hypothetical protein